MTRVFLDFLHDNRDIGLMAGHDGYTRYTLRIPDALYERVKSAAGEKSVNAEIISTLEAHYPEPRNDYSLTELFDALRRSAIKNGYPDSRETKNDIAQIDRVEENLIGALSGDLDMLTHGVADDLQGLMIKHGLVSANPDNDKETAELRFHVDEPSTDNPPPPAKRTRR